MPPGRQPHRLRPQAGRAGQHPAGRGAQLLRDRGRRDLAGAEGEARAAGDKRRKAIRENYEQAIAKREFSDRTDAIYLELEKRGVVTRPFSNEGIRVTIGSEEQNTRFLTTLAEVASAS